MHYSQALAKEFRVSLDRGDYDSILLQQCSEEQKDDADLTASPYFGFNPSTMSLYIKMIPSEVSRWDILDEVKSTPGFVSFSMSEPLRGQAFSRYAWISYDTIKHCSQSEELLKEVSVRDFALNPVKPESVS